MANTLKIKRGTAATIPQGQLAEPLFTTDTYDLYIGKGSGGNQRIQNYIASGTSSQFLKGDGTLDSTSYQPLITAGTTLQYYRGDKTFQTLDTSVVPENGPIYFTEPRVRATVLTGLNLSGGGTIAATDSILTAFGKVQNQISALVGGATYQGTWNASTNTPTLASGTGTKGYYYVVSVAGSTNLDGITDWKIGDWAIFNGTTWDKVDNTDAVSSVNGFTGAVNLALDNISDVSAASPTNAQLLRFNGTSSLWENWTPTFEPALTKGNLTEATSSVLTITGGTGAVIGSGTTIAVASAGAAQNGVVTTGTQTFAGAKTFNSSVTASALYVNGMTAGNGAIYHTGSRLTFANYNASGTLNFEVNGGASAMTINADKTIQMDYYTTNGFVKFSSSNGTLTVDTNTYLTTSSASSTYVPYSGANTNVNLGIYGLTAGVHLIANYNDQTPGASASRDVIQANTSFTPSGTTNVKTDWKNFNASFTINTTGTLTNYYGYYATAPTVTSGTITNKYSFYGASGAGIAYFADGMTLAGTLSGTSASFSGNVSAARFTPTGTTIPTVGMYSSASNFLDFSTNGTRAITISDGQKVGIGADPISAYRLYVNGDIYASATVYGSIASFTSGGTFGGSISATGGTFSGNVIVNTTTFAQIKINNAATTGSNRGTSFEVNSTTNAGTNFIGQFNAISNNANAPYSSTDAIYLMSRTSGIPLIFTTNNGGTEGERMRITSGGNVGIGVTPSAWMANSAALQVIRGGLWHDGSGYISMFNNAYYDGTNWRYISSTTATNYAQVNGTHQWFYAASGTAGNIVTFNPAMIINTSGNVGIGTTSPSYKLHVTNAADAPIARFTGGASANINVGIFATNEYGFASIGTQSNHEFHIYTNDTDRVTITTGGNVGIGTTSPATFLHVFGSNTSNRGQLSIQSNNTSNAAKATWYYDTFNSGEIGTTSSDFYALATNNFLFYASGAERMRITSGGNVRIYNSVGIGLNSGTDASTRLHIKRGDSAGMQEIVRLDTGNDANNDGSYINWTTGDGGTQVARIGGQRAGTDIGNILFETGNGSNGYTERMRITSGGNVELNGGSIKTGAPSGGTAKPWKLGARLSGTVSTSTTNYLEVEVDGTLYYLAFAVPL